MKRPLNNSNNYDSGSELEDLRNYANDLNKYIDFLQLKTAEAFNVDISNWDLTEQTEDK